MPLRVRGPARPQATSRGRKPVPMRVVVMAASAGGLAALDVVLSGLPSSFPAALLVVLHRGLEPESLLARVLQRHTRLSVKDAAPGESLMEGVVYVAPPDRHLEVDQRGQLRLRGGERVHHLLSAAEPLFASAAAAFGDRVIAVVLSGTGTDGAEAVPAVKAAGGVVIVQDEQTSEHFGMPAAAIASGAVDFILPIEEIATALTKLAAR